MTELITHREFGKLNKTRNEIVEVLNNPSEVLLLEEYFNNNKSIINGKEYYGCNGGCCDCTLARIFAMLKYVGQSCEYRTLNDSSTDTQLISIQNSYYHRYHLPVEDIQFLKTEELGVSSKILISGKTFTESKVSRVKDLGLEDFIIISDIE